MKKYANKILTVMIVIVVICLIIIVYKTIDLLTTVM